MDKGIPVSKLSEEYGIGKSTVYDISKKKKELFEFFEDSDTPLAMNNRKSVRYAKSDDHHKVMTEWVRHRRSEGVPLTGPMLMAQAKIFHKEMNLNTECTYSTSWLTKFKNRYGIRQLKISGEKASADTEAAEEFADEFIQLITSEQLSPEQIYSADETGIFLAICTMKYLGNLYRKGFNWCQRFQSETNNFSVRKCCRTGMHKCKLFVIGKYARPRAFKGIQRHLNSVGLLDDSKIDLTVDNCSAHTSLKVLVKDNVSLLFFSPNCMSIIQLMDMGIVHMLKCKYKVAFLKSMLNFMNKFNTIQEFLKYFIIKSAVWSIARSWKDVSPDTLKNAWHNLWPATIFHGEDDEDDSREFEGFRTSQTKGEIFQLLDYVKKCGEAIINEDDITEVFHCKDNAPIINQLTDGKICSMVLDPENTTSDSKESDKEEKIRRLKCSLMNVQDTHTVDHLKDLNVLYTLSLSQIPEFCKILNIAVLSETAIALFLSAILNLEQQISLATAVALIHHIVYPKIAGMKNSRIIFASILTFSEVYPKAVIDEVMIPSLKIESLDPTRYMSDSTLKGSVHIMYASKRCEHTAVVQFLTADNVSASGICHRIQNVYGMECMKHRSVFRWFRDFCSGRSSTDDRPQPGQAPVVISQERVADVECFMKMNQRTTALERVEEISMSIGSMNTILHERLRYRKVCAQWAPKHLTEEQKIHHMSVSMQHLMWYHKMGNQFFSKITATDETWCHHFDLQPPKA
ncbi:Jerky protein, partial [Stegodyphus mimosarum]